MHSADGEQLIAWTDIVSMIGYKRDYLTSDSICMGIFCENDRGFEKTEDMPGWFQFLVHMKKVFPCIDQSWETHIAMPAFETNLTLLYDRYNRPLAEVVKQDIESA
jgi:hypothetical protein